MSPLAFAVDSISLDKVVGAGLLLAIPWASSWKKINWHFSRENKSLSPVFNGLASVLSTLLFTGSVYKPPPEWWVRLPVWVGFAAAGLLAIAYVGVLFRYKAAVGQNKALAALLIGLGLYITLWGVAAVYTRQVFIFHDYRVYGGVAYLDGKPAAQMRLELCEEGGERLSETVTNTDGTWLDFRARRNEDGTEFTKRPTRLKLQTPDKVGSLERPLGEKGRLDGRYDFNSLP